MKKRSFALAAIIALHMLMQSALWAQTAPVTCDISGKVTSGGAPLPGVTISAANSLTGKKFLSSSDLDGTFLLSVGGRGRYVVRAELAAFAPATQEVVINPENCHPRVELSLTLLSRMQAAPTQEGSSGQQMATMMAARGFQNLGLNSDPTAFASEGQGETTNGFGTTDSAQQGMPPAAFAQEGATESVSLSGNQAQSNEFMFGGNDEALRERIQEMRDRAQRGELGPGDNVQIMGRGGRGPGGGFAGGGGPMGGPGSPGIMIMGGRMGRFNVNRPHGSLFYSMGDSDFDAAPYSLTGQPTAKPGYMQQRFGFVLGGPLNIPKIYNGGTKTFFFVNYFGNISDNPYDAFSNVPTMAQRSGDFSTTTLRDGQAVQILDPLTRQPFVNNTIPADRVSPAAQALLDFIPQPNLPGTFQNFHYVTAVTNNNHNFNFRLVHNFGDSPMFGGPRGGRGGNRNNLNLGFHYQETHSVVTNPFPTLGGTVNSTGWNIPIGWVRGKGKFTNNLRFIFSSNRSNTSNLYAFSNNVAGAAGITGVSQDPFDWGVPNLSFANFSGARDPSPSLRLDQNFTLSDNMILAHGKHTFRWGGDFRRIQTNTRTDSNGRGTFTFTGLYSGYDLADFLLGVAQQASIQFGPGIYHFRGNVWSGYFQDDWRVARNLTLNLGLRYEYYSPLTETNNRLVNLDVAPDFTAVAPVQPGGVGPFTGSFSDSLIDPDRNNFAPRVGIAWKPLNDTVIRAGYGINYNTTAYGAMALQLANQPPFASTETNLGTFLQPLSVQSAFGAATAATTNNFAVDRNYALGYVQIWNLNVQRQISRGVVLNVGYTGTKGTHLDMQRAPNRTPTGLLIADVQPFIWESSQAASITHSGTVQLRKRMSHGLSLGGSYTFSKSLDNASTIGGGTVVVAQNDLDLAAERGLSSFDRRHQLGVDWVYELPFGSNKRWLGGKGTLARAFGDWQWSGNFSIASGLPFTPRVVGAISDVNRGTNGTLRADVTGEPIQLDSPTIAEWFNTAAFLVPLPGTFGDARRNSIEGPGSALFNMAIAKEIAMGDTKGLEIRLQANNVFNTPQYTVIDTTVNSPSYGRVTSVGAMRRVQIVTRFRF